MQDLIAFIGGGNMAASLVGGLLESGCSPQQIRVAQRGAARIAALRERFGVEANEDVAATVSGAALVVLAVKPTQVAAALHGVALDPQATVISVAAGLRMKALQAILGPAVAASNVVRAMPNTPALFRAGVTGLYAPQAGPTARRRADELMQAVGSVCWVDSEDALDALTALSGCGPAYYFLVTEALRDAGTALGLAPDAAAALARDTFVGAARMARDSGVDVATLRTQVASKGGSTEAALEQLQADGLPGLFLRALEAARVRTRQRGDELDRLTQAAA